MCGLVSQDTGSFVSDCCQMPYDDGGADVDIDILMVKIVIENGNAPTMSSFVLQSMTAKVYSRESVVMAGSEGW